MFLQPEVIAVIIGWVVAMLVTDWVMKKFGK